jgi:hypothetical protein
VPKAKAISLASHCPHPNSVVYWSGSLQTRSYTDAQEFLRIYAANGRCEWIE